MFLFVSTLFGGKHLGFLNAVSLMYTFYSSFLSSCKGVGGERGKRLCGTVRRADGICSQAAEKGQGREATKMAAGERALRTRPVPLSLMTRVESLGPTR